MNPFKLAFLLLLSGSTYTFAQNQTIPKHPNSVDATGLRQGWWTIELDEDFMRPLTEKDIKFYRIIEFKDDKPVGVTRDYYTSGVLYQELTLRYFRQLDKRRYSQLADYTQPHHVYWEDGSENLIAPNRIQCEMLRSQGKYELALPFAEKALVATEKKLGKKNWRYAYFLILLGGIHKELGNYTKAEPLFFESVKITDALGVKGLDYVQSLNPLAHLYYLMGNHPRAEELSREA